MGVPMIQAFTVFRISVIFKIYAVLQVFLVLLINLGQTIAFTWYPLSLGLFLIISLTKLTKQVQFKSLAEQQQQKKDKIK